MVERMTAISSAVPTFLYMKLSTPAARACSTNVISGMPVMMTTRTSGCASLMEAAATMPLESFSVHTSKSARFAWCFSTAERASAASAMAATTRMSSCMSMAHASESRSMA